MTTTQETIIRHARRSDVDDLGRIIALAFHDDPTMRWITPDPERRALVGPAVFALYAELYVPLGHTYVTEDGSGAALWAGPGQQPVPEEQAEAFGQRIQAIMGEDAGRVFELVALFEEHEPATPCFHLQLLGTVPERQGQGIGAALLRTVLDDCDRDGIPAYLESTSPRNQPLYERHGFVATGTMAPVGGPTLTAMWREPR